ncbi:MAG TPA: orotate phosphoribosyltransferase, partial [Gammaproteobacteria bacterium]|nr:orotate phosphoribosyltransferase [Gammaproteobacteria bacterium]
DRQEKGLGKHSAVQEIEQSYQVPVKSIINLENLIDYMRQDKQLDSAVLSDLVSYRQQYGV